MKTASVTVIALLCIAGAGCGWPDRPDYQLPGSGLSVAIQTTAPWAHDPAGTFPTTLADDVDRAVAFWGGGDGALRGWELVLTDGNPCAGCLGLTEYSRNTMRTHTYPHCYPGAFSNVAHEIGHALIGDSDHHDPRWKIVDGGGLNPPGECVP